MSLGMKLAVLRFCEAAVGIEAVEPSKIMTDDDIITRINRATDRARALHDLDSNPPVDADIEASMDEARREYKHFSGKSD